MHLHLTRVAIKAWLMPDPRVDMTLGAINLSTTYDRDMALCPRHPRQLEGMLKLIPSLSRTPPQPVLHNDLCPAPAGHFFGPSSALPPPGATVPSGIHKQVVRDVD